MKKVIVAGSRDFNDYELMSNVIDAFRMRENDEIIIVSGGARGADKMGEYYAKENNLECHVFEANWSKYGRAAGHIRNEEMANHGDHLLAFWDGKSTGTQDMIKRARKAKIKAELFIT